MKFKTLVALTAFAALTACQTTSGTSSGGGIDTSSLSAGAKMVADSAIKDMAAVKSACKGGEEGVTQLVVEKATALAQEGKKISPAADAPEAGAFIGKNCKAILTS